MASMLIISILYSSSCFSSFFELESAYIAVYGKDKLGIIFLDDQFNRKSEYQEIKLPSSKVALCKSDGSLSPQDGFEFMAGPTRSELAIVLIINSPVRFKPNKVGYEIGEVIGIHATKIEKNSDSPFDLVFSDEDVARMAGSKEADLKYKQYWGKKVLDCIKRFYKEKK